jgi:hypothetical protein
MGVIGEDLDVLGISIVTFLRTITTVSLVVVVGISQIIYKHKLKWLYTLLGYLALVGIYATFHHYNIVNSGGYYITNGLYNFATELMYVLRLVVPIILMYIVVITKPKKERIEKAILVSKQLCIEFTYDEMRFVLPFIKANWQGLLDERNKMYLMNNLANKTSASTASKADALINNLLIILS